MLTDQPVGWSLVTDQAVNRSHADIKVVVRRVGLFKLRRENFIELRNKQQPDAEPAVYSVDEWTSLIDTAQYAVRDERGGVLIGRIYWNKDEWDNLLAAVARGAFMVLAHIPRTA